MALEPPAGPAASDPPPVRLSEADLVTLWAGQRLPQSALVTVDGAPLRVLHPGFRGRGAGPDFRDAIVTVRGGPPRRGDIELHVRAHDFQAHGHSRDARYNGLVLHVAFAGDGERETALASGRRVPLVALDAWLQRRSRELASWLASPALWREPCRDAVTRLGVERVLTTLDELGDGRLRERAAALGREVERFGPGEALYRALLAGMGYGGARDVLEAVGTVLPWRDLRAALASSAGAERVRRAEHLLLDAARLLPPERARPWDGRPANHPARRLAGLARLVARHEGVLAGDGVVLDSLLALSPARLIAAWTVAAPVGSGALIGRSRAIELLTNAVLPWSVATAGPRLVERAWAQLHALPRPARYGKLAFLESNLRDGGRALPLDVRRQQGLLALHKTECTQGGCGRCPFS